MMTKTAMVYTSGLMEMYIMDNTKRIIKMAKDITGGQLAMNIAENGRMGCNGEKESNKKTDNSTEINIIDTIASAELSYHTLLTRNECY
jgi:hypothetical protein